MADPRTIVYAGPSVSHDEVRRLLPQARIHPPVRHGDLARSSARPGDTVLLIDGDFLHSAAVRHKEILALLADGVIVAGSSSMGALRAAELAEYGMRGFGQIFDLYHRGAIDGDDEVAIVHTDDDHGFRPLSEPMVNIRLDLDRALAAAVLDTDQHARLIASVKAQPFRERCLPQLNKMAHALLGPAAAHALAGWLRSNHVDTKAVDARLLLALAARKAPPLRPADGDDQAITNQETIHAVGWAQTFSGRDIGGTWVPQARVADFHAITDSDFPRRYRAAVLQRLARSADDPTVRPTPDDPEHACRAAARRRGLLSQTGTLADSCLAWLTPAERDLPGEEAILRVLARSYGTRPAIRLAVLPGLVPDDPTASYRRLATVTAFADLILTRKPDQGTGRPERLRLKPETVDRFCAALWGCQTDELDAAVWDRGFATLSQLRRCAEDLAVHARWFAPQ